MQRQVADEIDRRTQTLAAISHDIRTPLTALRIKAELLSDDKTRRDFISSIERMEKITTSALEFLRGESRGEAMREIDLSALLESECNNFEEIGKPAAFRGGPIVFAVCRPEALARGVRNLIENAVEYGGGAEVCLRSDSDFVEIEVLDRGPGISPAQLARVQQPFVRLSKARDHAGKSGFGLGLAIVKAIAEGHDGTLSLKANQPTGLVATIRLPLRASFE